MRRGAGPPEPGMSLERTSLAWGRSALSIATIAGSMLKLSLQSATASVGIIAGGVLLALAVVVWAFGAHSYVSHDADDGNARRRRRLGLRLVCAVSVTSAILAFTLVVAS